LPPVFLTLQLLKTVYLVQKAKHVLHYHQLQSAGAM